MKFNTNNKAAQKQRRIGALERLREELAKGQKPSKIDGKTDHILFVLLSDTDRKRIEKDITLLEERTRI